MEWELELKAEHNMAYLLPITLEGGLVRHQEESEEDEGSGGKLVILERQKQMR